MSWKEIYNTRKKPAAEAIKLIKSGDRVALGHAAGVPMYLLNTLVDHKENYENIELVQLVPLGDDKYMQPGVEKHIRLNAMFLGGITKNAVKENRGDFTPCFLHEVPSMFDELIPLDVTMVQVSPPDKHGYVSLGISVDYTKAAVEKASVVIAEVNDQMPRTMGEGFIHVSKIDCFVEHSSPIHEIPLPHIGEVEKAIGQNCASLIKDGDTLQLGIGAIPDAVLKSLSDKKDLGIHSEMISDGAVDLMEAGVITNKRKSLNPGKCIVAFLMGTKRLYDYADENPNIVMMPADYVNHPLIASQNDNLIAINACVQVDFMGQVCSESIGPVQISGVGGQVDFVRSATMSKGGKAIIAMPSTAAKGKVSRIVPLLDEGAAVTTGRTDVDYIVTEYGIARLKGKTLKNRAKALISIAHPDFRPGLIAAFEEKYNCSYQ